MLRPTGLQRATVRTAFNEQPGARAQADFLYREIERRMLERLDLIRLQPVNRVLDVGCGSGHSLATLAVRYPRAQMIGLDFADRAMAPVVGRAGPEERLRESARRWLSQLGIGGSRQLPATMPLWLVADAHALAVAANSIDMVWSNLAAHWFDDPLAAVAEWHRVIRPEGLLMFSAFGVDTLKEVRAPRPPARAAEPPALPATADADAPDSSHADTASWPTYQDMHDWGDALAAAGFADPVMDVERLTLTYEEAGKFWDDVRCLSMMPGLAPHGSTEQDDKKQDEKKRDETKQGETKQDEPATRSLSIEVIYGHAWCPAVKRRLDGLDILHFHAPGASYNRNR